MAPGLAANKKSKSLTNVTSSVPSGAKAPNPLSTKSNKNHSENAGCPTIVDNDGIDRTPQPLYVSSYSMTELRGVGAVGGLKVGTDDGIHFPENATPPLCVTSTSSSPDHQASSAKPPPAPELFVGRSNSLVTISEDDEKEEVADSKVSGKLRSKEQGGSKHHTSSAAGNDAPAASATSNAGSGASHEDEEFIIKLTETPTTFLVSIAGMAMSNDAPNYQKVQKRNAAYEKVLEGRDHADNLRERHTQTVNFAQKTKSVLAIPAKTTSVECQASDWDIHDSYQTKDIANDDVTIKSEAASGSVAKSVSVEHNSLQKLVSNYTSALSSKDALLDVAEAEAPTVSTQTSSFENLEEMTNSEDVISSKKNASILSSNGLFKSLELMERAVQQNLYHESHLRYRNYPSGNDAKVLIHDGMRKKKSGRKNKDDGDESIAVPKKGVSMSKLFTFNSNLASGRTATTMSWNRGNKDILAVGYGAFHLSDSEKEGGLVLFWSIRNPAHPEKIIKTVSGVTAIDFSTAHPNMLAVGMYDGTVAIYDCRKEVNFDVPVLESSSLSAKHMDPVWEVKWVDKGPERGESLVTIATDGRVLEWNMKKGLSLTPLMVLKRVGNSEGVISRQASGLCLDFPIDDSSVYFAGTEDGHIHRCSCSYNEQYLDTFSGHSGPVYKIRCSPFHPEAFLSCSADWTVKLWTSEKQNHIFDFHSVDLSDVVNDIVWSPTDSTVFASVTGDGRVEVWDLNYSVIDPKLFYKPSKAEAVLGVTPLTIVRFSDNAPVLATGDAKGKVDIFRLEGLETDVQKIDWKAQKEKLGKML